MQTAVKQIKLTRLSGAVDSIDHEAGTIEGHAGSVKLESRGMSVEQALTLAQAAPDLLGSLEEAETALKAAGVQGRHMDRIRAVLARATKGA